MNRFLYTSAFSILFLVLFTFVSQAQVKTLTLQNEESKMTIEGTSTLHDWTSEVNEMSGTVTIKSSLADQIEAGEGIQDVEFKAKVESIESGRGSTMDKRTYNALKYEEHPEIIFKLDKGDITSVSGSSFQLNTSGQLTIAGETKEIELNVEGKKLSDGKFQFQGSKAINMTEYNVEPPTAMFGQIVTGEEVTINFDLVFSN